MWMTKQTVSSMFNLQALSIERAFDRNLKELHLCYLKSPKHGEFGLSSLCGYLNYESKEARTCL